jgi:hypothetical protein
MRYRVIRHQTVLVLFLMIGSEYKQYYSKALKQDLRAFQICNLVIITEFRQGYPAQ